MQKNKLREMWRVGTPTINAWSSIGNPFVAEIMAAQGYDSLTVDLQHGALDYTDLLPIFQATKASGATLMARVPWLDPAAIMKAMDAGAMGIICPMINNRREAEEFVSYMRYPPNGQRSFGPTLAVFAHENYGVAANDEILAIAMIETKEGAENLAEITSTPGLDGIYVGPADLTLGTQQGRLPPGLDRQEPEVIEIIQNIAKECQKNGIGACIHCGTPEYAAQAISWGYNLTTVAGDVRLLAAAASKSISAFHDLTGRVDAPDQTEAGY